MEKHSDWRNIMTITKFFKRSRMGKVGIDRIKSPCSIYVASNDDFCQLMLFKNDDDTRAIVLMAPEELMALKNQIDHCARRFLNQPENQHDTGRTDGGES
jgi:hypothetical protein